MSSLPRLFTAILPPARIVTELGAALEADPRWPPPGWRPVPQERWHLTLCCHGAADPGVLARELETATGPARAPWLRLAGAVAFPRVVAAGLQAGDDTDARTLIGLVGAAGGDPGGFRAHLTLARTARHSDNPPGGSPPVGFVGSWWRPAEVCLVRSGFTSGSPRYTVLHRVALVLDDTAEPSAPHHRPDVGRSAVRAVGDTW